MLLTLLLAQPLLLMPAPTLLLPAQFFAYSPPPALLRLDHLISRELFLLFLLFSTLFLRLLLVFFLPHQLLCTVLMLLLLPIPFSKREEQPMLQLCRYSEEGDNSG
jgi:hypothetical protein